MKSIYLSFLLIVLQVHSYHHPRHHRSPDGNKITSEDQQPSLDEEQGNKFPYYQKIAFNNAKFAFELYRLIASHTTDKNIFFSPLSISTAFGMLTLGARSETQNQIFQGLAFNLSEIEENEIHKGFHQLIHELSHSSNKAQVHIGNALFIEETLKILPKFLEDVKSLYEAEGFSSNFEDLATAKHQINEYVRNKTQGKITQAVEDLDPHTVLILINYIYFKAFWENPFDADLTREEDFFPDANTTVKVNMMYRQGYYNMLYDKDLSCYVVEVPYKGNASALFILPDEGKMQQVEGALAIEILAKWKTSFTLREIHLLIPKVLFSASYDVKELLQKLGIIEVFTDNADLSGITGQPNLKVSKALHKVVVDIHESGTEAAAVTVIDITPRSNPHTTIKYNRPSLLLIVNKATQTILFAGKIFNPTKQ
nr:alpha-1-antitrypsin-like isoform X1 [Pogona vitticeps]XP_020670071.1 alpha-1-antitrypsin-like isoform X2 [Pogona vitticeps]XP_020670072.1 alpha-1-antitrypsin-like isoform X3 [Pogona vitticeps]